MARTTRPRASAAKTSIVTFDGSDAGYGALEAPPFVFPLGTPVAGVPASVIKALKALPGGVRLSTEPEETPEP